MVIRLTDPDTGNLLTYGRFEEGHLLHLTDLLPNGQRYDSLQLRASAPSRNIARLHKCSSKAVLYRNVAMDFLRLVLDDLIDTGNHYKLPVSTWARWRVVAKSRAETRLIARRNLYKFVDLEKSRGRIYEIVMEYRAHGHEKRRILRVDYARYKRLAANAENGVAFDLS